MKIYLDNCCFNRPFDDQSQLRIRLETEAKLEIQRRVIAKKIDLVWSYVLDLENSVNPFEQRKNVIKRWRDAAVCAVTETDEIIRTAKELYKWGIHTKDALHLASAVGGECDFFLSTDDHLIKKASKLVKPKVMDPIVFIKEEETDDY